MFFPGSWWHNLYFQSGLRFVLWIHITNGVINIPPSMLLQSPSLAYPQFPASPFPCIHFTATPWFQGGNENWSKWVIVFRILLVIDWPKGGHTREANVIQEEFYQGETSLSEQNDKALKEEKLFLIFSSSCLGLGCIEQHLSPWGKKPTELQGCQHWHFEPLNQLQQPSSHRDLSSCESSGPICLNYPELGTLLASHWYQQPKELLTVMPTPQNEHKWTHDPLH